MIPKASPAFAPPDMPPEVGTGVCVALAPAAAPALGVDSTCVNGAVMELATGVGVLVLVLKAELLVVCVSNVVLGAADSGLL